MLLGLGDLEDGFDSLKVFLCNAFVINDGSGGNGSGCWSSGAAERRFRLMLWWCERVCRLEVSLRLIKGIEAWLLPARIVRHWGLRHHKRGRVLVMRDHMEGGRGLVNHWRRSRSHGLAIAPVHHIGCLRTSTLGGDESATGIHGCSAMMPGLSPW